MPAFAYMKPRCMKPPDETALIIIPSPLPLRFTMSPVMTCTRRVMRYEPTCPSTKTIWRDTRWELEATWPLRAGPRTRTEAHHQVGSSIAARSLTTGVRHLRCSFFRSLSCCCGALRLHTMLLLQISSLTYRMAKTELEMRSNFNYGRMMRDMQVGALGFRVRYYVKLMCMPWC